MDKGEVVVGIGVPFVREISSGGWEAEVVISVRNEGSFIPLAERENIFRRFYRSPGSNLKAPGTGIGLSVVRQVTEAHHGRAWVNSDPQTGTTFFVTLPRTAREE